MREDTFSSLNVKQGFSTVLVLISNLENNRRSLDAKMTVPNITVINEEKNEKQSEFQNSLKNATGSTRSPCVEQRRGSELGSFLVYVVYLQVTYTLRCF